MSNVIYLHHFRPLTRIPPAHQTVYDDACLEFARRIELGMYVMEQAEEQRFRDAVSVLHGAFSDSIPSDT